MIRLLKTFSSKQSKNKSPKKSSAVESDRKMFARLLLMQERRGVIIKDILLYELTSYPLSLATEAGDQTNTAKSKLVQRLDEEIPTIQERPTNCYIYDGIVIL